MSNGSVNVPDDVSEGVWDLVAIVSSNPAVIDAEHDISSVADEFARQSAHDIFRVKEPSAAMNDDNAGQIFCAVRRIDIVFQLLHARLGIHHILSDSESLQRFLFDERRANGSVLVNED